jgi:hypothetical protein
MGIRSVVATSVGMANRRSLPRLDGRAAPTEFAVKNPRPIPIGIASRAITKLGFRSEILQLLGGCDTFWSQYSSYKISAIFIRRSFDELYDSMLELFFVIVLIGRQ